MSGLLKKGSSASPVACGDKQSTVRAYCRCNSGHYFQGEFCPFDGWSSAASKELTEAVRELASCGKALSIEALQKSGVSGATLERTILIHFGSTVSAFEALAPKEYVVNGKPERMPKVSPELK